MFSIPQQVAHFDEEQAGCRIVGRALHIHSGRNAAQREVGVTVVVAKIHGRARMQKIGQEHIGRKLLRGRERPAGVIKAAEASLHIEKLRVGDCRVVIENQPQRQFFCELIIQFRAIQVIVENTLPG